MLTHPSSASHTFLGAQPIHLQSLFYHTYFIWWHSTLMQVLCLDPDYSLFIHILHIKVFTILNVHTCTSFLVKVVWKWWPSKLVKKSSGWIVFLIQMLIILCCEQKLLVKLQHRTAHVWTQQIEHLSPHNCPCDLLVVSKTQSNGKL